MKVTLDQFIRKRESEEDLQLRSIEYSRTFRVKQFESEKIQVGADLDPSDDFDACLKELKARVIQAHETLKATLEPPPVEQVPKAPEIPYDFDPKEFLDHDWKGRRKDGGGWEDGSLSWGWDFAVDKDGNKQFSDAAMKLLNNANIKVGGDYVVSLNEDKTLVQIRKAKGASS